MKAIPRLIAALVVFQQVHAAEPATFAVPEPVRAPAAAPVTGASGDNEEIARLYREDQDDRRAGQTIDWTYVIPRDAARMKRVKELYAAGALRTGTDYYNVAMVLQHGETPEDFLLAHELCIVAIIKGEDRAKWLAAASEDRFLMKIGRPQRFGTQYEARSPATKQSDENDNRVTDSLRRELNVPARGANRPDMTAGGRPAVP